MRNTHIIAVLIIILSLNALAEPRNSDKVDNSNMAIYNSSCTMIAVQVWTNYLLLDESYQDLTAGENISDRLEIIKLSNSNIKRIVKELKAVFTSKSLRTLLSRFDEICLIIDQDLTLLLLYEASGLKTANNAFTDNHKTLYERIYELYSI